MPVIAVFNQKGGVGKTTTTLNVAAALLRDGTLPILLDLDPQAHLTLALGLRNVPADSTARTSSAMPATARAPPTTGH